MTFVDYFTWFMILAPVAGLFFGLTGAEPLGAIILIAWMVGWLGLFVHLIIAFIGWLGGGAT